MGLYTLGDNKITTLFADKYKELIKYLKTWSNTKYKNIPQCNEELDDLLNKYHKSNHKYNNKLKELRIAYILNLLGAETIASIVLTKFLNIIANKDDVTLNNQTNINVSLGKQLFDNVVKVLYRQYKTKCEDTSHPKVIMSLKEWVEKNDDLSLISLLILILCNFVIYIIAYL